MPLSISEVSSGEKLLQERLAKLTELQSLVSTEPYSIVLRVKLATAYNSLGYPDLAAGDAYKALLLVDEIIEEGEYHEEALTAALSDITSCSAHALLADGCDGQDHDETYAIAWARACGSKLAYEILISSLINCGCLRSAFDFATRALKAFRNNEQFQAYHETLHSKLRSHFASAGEDFSVVEIHEYPDKGTVRRELYPWNNHEPDRYSDSTIKALNDELADVAPRLEVKIAELPNLSNDANGFDKDAKHITQLGVFAKEDISAGEVILQEKSILTAISRLHETYCDACSATLPKSDSVLTGDLPDDAPRACEECGEVFFCGAECEALARANYHPAICGVDTEQKVPASEAADSLYTLLLVRALALAETRNVHPLDLKEVHCIWGDYHGLDLKKTLDIDFTDRSVDPFRSIPKSLPFSFQGNILTPLHMLEKMDVNIFEQSYRYDTWVFNTLYAKFRGTASAQQGLDGRPEIGAVHPLWCLANHSCDPNVAWEWQGSIKFWTREQLIDWKGRNPDAQAGLRKGEEVLSHYCDIRLPVKERREWAVGALGGNCMCRRCVWEDAEETR